MRFSIILLLGAVCVYESAAFLGLGGGKWKTQSHKAKYSQNVQTGYFNMPKTLKDKSIKEYVQIPAKDAKLSFPGTLWCHPNDARVCVMFDKNGVVAGVQVSFLEEDVKVVEGYDYNQHLDTYVKTNIFNTPAYSMRVYYDNPEKLASGRSATKETASSVWVKLKGQLVEVPRKDPKVEVSGSFYRQSCFPQMGQHYFYEMSKNLTDCPKRVPFFGLYHNGGLIGFGIATYGKGSTAKGGREWYENVPLLAVNAIMPNRPSCVDDLVNKNGLYSLHVYFVDDPHLIGCL